MAIVRAQTGLPQQSLGAVPLARYAQLLPLYEDAFWGIERNRDLREEYSAWTLRERNMIAQYLDASQALIEDELGYPLNRRWFEHEALYRYPIKVDHGYVVEGGIAAWTLIEADVAVDKTGDPHTISVTTTVTDEDEIVVTYPASLVEGRVEINPSDIDIAGGTADIAIPRCRTVKPSEADNPETGLDYEDDAFFLDEVDAWRRYNDPSTHATLVWPHRSTSTVLDYCAASCDEYTKNGCIYVRDERLGILDIRPATYDAADGWSACQTCITQPERVHVYYRAGLETIPAAAETAVIRLANTMMPRMPCGCEKFALSWEQDNTIPKTMTRERVNNPFGIKDGAWAAWAYVVDHRLGEGLGVCA